MFSHMASLEGKIVVHLSHNDLDGFGPEVVANLSNVNTVDFIHAGYGNFEKHLAETLETYDDYDVLTNHALLITDIAPSSLELIEFMNRLSNEGLTIVLLDHHDTNKHIAESFPEWAFISSTLDGKKTCATELYYLYLKEKDLLSVDAKYSAYVSDFVEQIRSYDTWDWTITDNPTAKELNSLFYIVGSEQFMQMQTRKIAEAFENDTQSFQFNETETLLLAIDARAEEKYIKSRKEKLAELVWDVAGKNYQVGVVFGEQYISVLGNELHKANPHLDFVAVIDSHGGKVSLRSVHKHIHVGEIAKAIHPKGGGHPSSAGFEYDYETTLIALETVMGVAFYKASLEVVEHKSPFAKFFGR